MTPATNPTKETCGSQAGDRSQGSAVKGPRPLGAAEYVVVYDTSRYPRGSRIWWSRSLDQGSDSYWTAVAFAIRDWRAIRALQVQLLVRRPRQLRLVPRERGAQ